MLQRFSKHVPEQAKRVTSINKTFCSTVLKFKIRWLLHLTASGFQRLVASKSKYARVTEAVRA